MLVFITRKAINNKLNKYGPRRNMKEFLNKRQKQIVKIT